MRALKKTVMISCYNPVSENTNVRIYPLSG